MSVKL
jgi:hypothetical protein